jgi:hypothetical protein
MSFNNDVMLYLKFDNALLLDEVSGEFNSQIVLGESPLIEEGRIDNALRLSPKYYIETTQAIQPTSALTVAFWLKPVNPGFGIDGGTVADNRMPLFGKSDFSIGASEITATNHSFSLSEINDDDENNRLEVVLSGSSGDFVAVSEPYKTGQWHFFWISFDGTSSSLKIFIDGYDSGISESGDVPSSLSSSTSRFWINRLTSGKRSLVLKNTGLLDDLVLISSYKGLTDDVVKAMNLGILHIIDSDFEDTREISFGSMSNDPPTISSHAISTPLGTVSGNSKGDISHGFKPVWETDYILTLPGVDEDLIERNPEAVSSTKPESVIRI